MAVKISDLVAATAMVITDILHLRTSGAIDKKITYEDFREEDVGEVKAYITKTRPFRIWCNGATISKTTNTEYTTLVDLIKIEVGGDAAHPMYHADADKVVLPDLRGAAIRGIDDTSNRDKDNVRKAGNYQADGNDPHVHDITHGHNYYELVSGAGASGSTIDNSNADGSNFKRSATNSDIIAYSGNSGNEGSGEGTMKNIALYYLIKY